jgi:lysozyme family protein
MTDFDIAYQRLFKIEGGFVNDPHDNGGATNFGLSSKFLNSLNLSGNPILKALDENHDGVIENIEIKDMKSEDAKEIFRFYWWLDNHYDKLDNQDLANNVFDFAVHAGSHKANTLLQQTINAQSSDKITEDGIIGTNTVEAANNTDNLLELYKSKRKLYYMLVVKNNPSQQKYLHGWLNRVDI